LQQGRKHLPNAGCQRNVVLVPNIGQVKRARVVQLHLTLSDGGKVKARKGKAGSPRSGHSRLGGAGLAISRRTIFDN